MPARDDDALLRRIARMYYREDLDQAQIAATLGISKSTVSRKLTAARESGIVQIRIVGEDHVERVPDLENRLRERFALTEVRVADADAGLDPLRAVGLLCADVFAERAPQAACIGFGWGLTTASIIDAIPAQALRPDTVLTSLVGGMPSIDTGPSGNNQIFTLAEKCGVRARRFDAPAVVESPVAQRVLLRESSVATSLEFARRCDLAFVGVGAFGVRTSGKVLAAMRFTDEERRQVLRARPVGDMVGRAFDAAGTPLGPPSSDRVIALTIADLARIPLVVGAAAGIEKTQGVLGALRTGALDALVVDRDLAESLVFTGPADE